MLDIDIATILWQILNFLLLAALLSKLLYQPALRYMRERAAKVGQSMDDAKKAQAEAEAMRQLLSERLKGAQKEADRILRQAREQAEEQAWGVLRKAEAEAQAIQATAQSEIREARAQAIAENSDEVLNTVIELASITLQKAATQAVHDDLVNVFNSHIWKLGQTDRQRVETYRTMMAERQPLARVFTPTPSLLSSTNRSLWR